MNEDTGDNAIFNPNRDRNYEYDDNFGYGEDAIGDDQHEEKERVIYDENGNPINTSDEESNTDDYQDDNNDEVDNPDEDVNEDAEVDNEEENAEDSAYADDEMKVLTKDGEEVTIAELKEGYSKDGDYRRKTAEAAEIKKAANQAIERATAKEESYNTKISDTQNLYNILHSVLQSNMPEKPNEALLNSNNPQDVQRLFMQKARYDAAVDQIAQLASYGEQLEQQKTAQEEARKSEKAVEEMEKLTEKYPFLKSNNKRKEQFLESVMNGAEALGFSLDEVNDSADHRMVEAMYYIDLGKKAEQRMAANKKNVKQRSESPSKNKRPARNATGANGIRQSKQREKFMRTRDVKDALAAYDSYT